MIKQRGKNIFSDKLKEKYPFLAKSNSDSVVFCTKCRTTFSISSGGNSDITRHIKTKKHEDTLLAAAGSKDISCHFHSALDKHVAAMEGVWAYHVINSNHSFQSSDCASNIFKTCFQLKKFSCSQKKCQAIVKNVFAPHAEELLKINLKLCSYVSIYTDASNHGNIKIFPVLVRYFLPTDGVHVKLLNLTRADGETSELIFNKIMKAVEKFDLSTKVICFCGDNAKVNFGGETRGGQNNVFYRLKQVYPNLLGVGCVAHVTHNALKFACEEIPFDVEWVVVKIYSHFYLNTVRDTKLKAFCEESDVEYEKLLGYAKTRFLALAPAVQRILKIFDALQTYFRSIKKGEKKLKDFFDCPSSKFWLLFVLDQVRKSITITF